MGQQYGEASAYEQRAWAALVEQEQRRQKAPLSRAADVVRQRSEQAIARIKHHEVGAKVLEAGDAAAEKIRSVTDATILKALEGGFQAVFLPAVRSVSIDRRVNRLAKRHTDFSRESAFHTLDLKALDKGRPTLTVPFLGVLESSVASLAVTGATVSTTVTGGTTAAVAVAAVASDVVASMALLGRAVAEVAVQYGYDPREPEEQLFLMSVLSYTTATDAGGKTAALAALSRLTQQMMRQATWKQLSGDAIVRLIQGIFKSVGVRLTHGRLAGAVPVAGVLLAAGLSFHALNTAVEDATRIYRARFLAEKHGWNWTEALTRSEDPMSDGDAEPLLALIELPES